IHSLLILDEATSYMTSRDVETVYGLLQELRSAGTGMLFISHRMHEVEALCDTLSVFRNGRHIETFAKGEKSQGDIVRLMIGRDVEHQFPKKPAPEPRPPHLAIAGLKWENRLNGVDLEVGKGEIVGLGGLDGQGQKELLLALFGVLRSVSGSATVGGQNALTTSPADAKGGSRRIALVPEDRKAGGLTLSGGNQQKVVIAKWLMTQPEVILLNDPTRGIDVGTKQELYRLMRDLADEGNAILFYSTDYAELIGCCDRVAVMYGGRIVTELEGDAITEEAIIAASLNISTGRSATVFAEPGA